MTDEKDNEKLQLLLFGELEEDDRQRLLERIEREPRLNREYQSLRVLFESVSEELNREIPAKVLYESRMELRGALRQQRNKKSLAESFTGFLRSYYRPAAAAFAALAAGIMIGHHLWTQTPETPVQSPVNAKSELRASLNPVLNCPKRAAVPPVKAASKLTRKKAGPVREELFASEANAGEKLRRLSEILLDKKGLNLELQDALISTLETDKNPGVRLVALNALLRYGYDEKIKNALIDVLTNDKNAGLRVASINALIGNEKEIGSDKKLFAALNSKAANENNQYIRMRAKAALREISL